MNLSRRGFIAVTGSAMLALAGCSQTQQSEADKQNSEEQTSPAVDYLNSEEVSGFLSESENIETISQACQNKDVDTCSERGQALIDACDALTGMDEVPGEVADIHSELTQAAEEFRNAAVSYMTAVYVDDDAKFENAVSTASEHLSAGSDHLVSASEMISELS